MAEKIPHCNKIEKHILECIRGGVTVKQTLASIQRLPNAPSAMATMYKTYGVAMEAERARLSGAVGKRVIDHAMVGPMEDKSTQWAAELFLRSKAGWSPSNTNVEVEQDMDPETDLSAADEFMALLGIKAEETNKD